MPHQQECQVLKPGALYNSPHYRRRRRRSATRLTATSTPINPPTARSRIWDREAWNWLKGKVGGEGNFRYREQKGQRKMWSWREKRKGKLKMDRRRKLYKEGWLWVWLFLFWFGRKKIKNEKKRSFFLSTGIWLYSTHTTPSPAMEFPISCYLLFFLFGWNECQCEPCNSSSRWDF